MKPYLRPTAAAPPSEPSFDPPPVIRNRHLQSFLSSTALRRRLIRWRARDLIEGSEAVEIPLPDGVRLMGYHSPLHGSSKGLVIFIHGWEGSADSQYVLSAARLLRRSGFEIFRLNLRDHGDTHHLNPELFHSCRIDEVVAAVAWLVNRYPAPARFLVGYSLGGNFCLRVALRSEAAGIDIDKVIAVCPVLSPANTMQVLEQGPWVYLYYFLRKWRRSLNRKAQLFPHLYDFGDLRRFPTLTETTDFFVRQYTPFETLEDYLNGYAIVDNALAGLSVPSRVIAARDDPVIPAMDLARLAQCGDLKLIVTENGGHCGFLSGAKLHSWVDEEVLAHLTR